MSEFKSYHPIANFIYFALVIGFSMFILNPVCLGISLLSGLAYSIMQSGKKAIKFNLAILPLALITALLNPVFSHEGMTILCYLPSGNPLTLESIIYGVCAAVMLWSVVSHFACFNKIMTSDKFIYLFGKIIPSLSLILSMTLRFIPKFREQIKIVSNAQRGIGRDASSGNVFTRAKNGIKILGIMITWSLENAITTADSMKSRGYGLENRTAFSNYKISNRDIVMLCIVLFLGIYIICGCGLGKIEFIFFPTIKAAGFGIYEFTLYFAYFALFISPIIIEIREVIKWKKLKSRI